MAMHEIGRRFGVSCVPFFGSSGPKKIRCGFVADFTADQVSGLMDARQISQAEKFSIEKPRHGPDNHRRKKHQCRLFAGMDEASRVLRQTGANSAFARRKEQALRVAS